MGGEAAAAAAAATGGYVDDGLMDTGMLDAGGDVINGEQPEDLEGDVDALGAAGGMPGDLTGVGGGGGDAAADTAGGGFAELAESGDVKFRPVPAAIAELAPSGAPDEPLRVPGEGMGTV
jgi:hypothetical protein